MLAELAAEIEASRKRILSEISGATDVTLVRGYGNIGDNLIYAGTRQLLAPITYREASVLHLEGVRGELGILTGGGAWCAAHPDTARLLPEVESRFERLIVLPSSFDISEPLVRERISRTKALLFARELVSFEQIRHLCKAALAFDCAFFLDFRPYIKAGAGTLHAYRLDRESTGRQLPADNNDISLTCTSLDQWLWTIAQHDSIVTDRAHVLIAGAMLGKRCRYRASNYHKVPAIVDYSLKPLRVLKEESADPADVRVELLRQANANLALLPDDFLTRHNRLEVTIVILSHKRLDETIKAVGAVCENVRVPFKLLIVDNNSGAEVQAALGKLTAHDERMELVLLDHNLGCAGGRDFAFRHVTTPYVLLLDNDVEMLPGALEHLLFQFDQNPEALGVTGRIVFPNGNMHLCGADLQVKDDVLFLELLGLTYSFQEKPGESGFCKLVPGALSLIRMEALTGHPYDLKMNRYFEDLDWCYSVGKDSDRAFVRSVDAIGIHNHQDKIPPPSLPLEDRLPLLSGFLEALGHFYEKHGLVINTLFSFVPELGPADNHYSISSAKVLLSLASLGSGARVNEKWLAGDLDWLFVTTSELRAENDSLRQQLEDARMKFEGFTSNRSWKLASIYTPLRRSARVVEAALNGSSHRKPERSEG